MSTDAPLDREPWTAPPKRLDATDAPAVPSPDELAAMLADAEPFLQTSSILARHVRRLVPIVQGIGPAVDVDEVMRLVGLRCHAREVRTRQLIQDGKDWAETADIELQAMEAVRAALTGRTPAKPAVVDVEAIMTIVAEDYWIARLERYNAPREADYLKADAKVKSVEGRLRAMLEGRTP